MVCIDPQCTTNSEPDIPVGKCPVCAAAGKDATMYAHRNPKTLKRSVQCENFDECNTRYPLPQNGAVTATGEVCPTCGAPKVTVTTARGPWTLCPNFDCPSKANDAKKSSRGSAKKSSSAKAKGSAKKTSSAKASTKSTKSTKSAGGAK